MKLLTGQANSGKSEIIFTRMAERLSAGQGNPLLIAPSTGAVEVLLKRLRAFMPKGLPERSRPVPISFPALSQNILKLAGMKLNFLTAIQRDRLLRGVIAELAEQVGLVYFDRTAGKAGLAHSLAAFIIELSRSNTTASEFASLTQCRSKKDKDIATIFNRYELAMTEVGAIDAEGAGLQALRLLERIAQGELPDSERVIKNIKANLPFIAADGFDFYSVVQVKMLSRLSQLGIEVMATLSYEDDRAVHLWQKPTLDRFVGEQAEIIHCSQRLKNPISQAAAALMNDNPSEKSANGTGAGITITSAPDRAVEVRAVAREIKRLMAAENYAPDDITVVCRSLNIYAHHFERVFREGSIAMELDNQIVLGENPLIVALLRLLGLGENLFRRRAVIESLRSPYFELSEFALDDGQVDLLEHISLTEKITHQRDQWMDAIEPRNPARQSSEGGPAKLAAQEMRSSLAPKLEKFFDALSFARSARRIDYVRQIEHLIHTLKISEKASRQSGALTADQLSRGSAFVVEGIGTPLVEQMAEDENALTVFRGLLKTLTDDNHYPTTATDFDEQLSEELTPVTMPLSESRGKERPINWATFFAELQSAVAATSFRRPEMKSAAIVVQEAHNLRPRNYRAIFVTGLIEGEFPRKTSETTPYTLAEKLALRKGGIDFAETIHDAGADLTQFHKAMTRASERLYLSYARSDFSGGELLRSYLVDEVIDVANPIELTIAQNEFANEMTVREDALSLDELAIHTARQMRRQFAHPHSERLKQTLLETSRMLGANLRSWPATRRGAAMEHRRLSGRERGIFGGIIENQKLMAEMSARFGEDFLWSASKLNDYGICPFRFFAVNVLNLTPVEEPTEGFVADRLGTVYHEILEKTFKQLKEEGLELTVDTLDKATEIAEKKCETALQKLLEERKVRRGELWDFDKSEIKKRVVNLLRSEMLANQEQAARPLAFEQPFGYGNQPPLVIANSEGLIKIRGTIDRIDETEDGLVVIDYKTSRSPISAREATEGRNLQLPIYLMAANRVLKRAEPVTAGFYLHIYSCRRGSELPNKNLSLDDITAQAEAYIGEYVGKVRRAEFPVEPNQHRCPPYCKFDVMCRIQSLGSTTDDE